MTAILADLERELAGLPPGEIPAALGELERLRALSWPRLLAGDNGSAREPAEDRLLDAKEAAIKLGMKADYLYRHADRLPFTIRPAPGHLRFSMLGIEKFIRQRSGLRQPKGA